MATITITTRFPVQSFSPTQQPAQKGFSLQSGLSCDHCALTYPLKIWLVLRKMKLYLISPLHKARYFCWIGVIWVI